MVTLLTAMEQKMYQDRAKNYVTPTVNWLFGFFLPSMFDPPSLTALHAAMQLVFQTFDTKVI